MAVIIALILVFNIKFPHAQPRLGIRTCILTGCLLNTITKQFYLV